MANGYYHCSVKSVGRAKGRSAVAAAAYRTGTRLSDVATGLEHDFTRRKGVIESFIVLPPNAPGWAGDREKLWNEAGRAESRSNGRIATELELALPHELDAEERHALVERFAQDIAIKFQVAVDVALHLPGDGGDHRNHHAHLLVTHRELGSDGFGEVANKHRVMKKIKGIYREIEVAGIAARGEDVAVLRRLWADAVNTAYGKAGLDIEVDHRSHRDRGIQQEPSEHMGPAAAAMERRGETSERGDANRNIFARNTTRKRMEEEEEEVSAQIIDLRAERAKRASERAAQGLGHSVEELLEELTERRSVFTWRDLNRLIGKEIEDPKLAALYTDEILKRSEIIRLRETSEAPVSHYTTRDILEAERALLKDAAILGYGSGHGLRASIVERMGAALTLNEEQGAALRHATGKNGFAIIAGEAGTGKSRTLGAIRAAYEASGYRVTGLSWTNAVVQDMRADGFANASTIASELMRLGAGKTAWGTKDVLIVDEAAMLATKHLAEIIFHAREAGAKVIFAGDERQLASIERGGMFEPLRTAMGAAELHVVQRVKDPEQQRAFNAMHDGNFREALGIFDRQGAVRWSDTTDQAAEALTLQYAVDLAINPDKKRFIFAYTNKEVDALNGFAREVWQERGKLGADREIMTKHGMTNFAEGDRVQFTDSAWSRAAKASGLVNGVVGTVVEIEAGSGKPRMAVELDGVKGEDPRRVSFMVGPNREAGEFDGVRHGYAGTIYKGQGRTLDETYVFHSDHWREASSYVALSRHREEVAIFVARENTPDIERLARQMSRDETKRAASSFYMDGELFVPRAETSELNSKLLSEARKTAEAVRQDERDKEGDRENDREAWGR